MELLLAAGFLASPALRREGGKLYVLLVIFPFINESNQVEC